MGNPSCLNFSLEKLSFLPHEKVVMVSEIFDGLVKGVGNENLY